jgi:uncharacterized protein
MSALLPIAATSALGSAHCIAMCGPLVGLHGGVQTLRLAAVHSLGRMAAYVAIGAVAGALGSALDLAGDVANVQRLATLIAGVAIVAWGVAMLAGARRRSRPSTSPFAHGLVKIRTKRPATRAWLVGVLTGALPCGWLWAFALTAGGSGHATSGALVMFAFWLGTVPAMLGVLAFAGPMLARLRGRIPAITAVALIAIGLATLGYRWRDAGAQGATAPHCHCHGVPA